MESFKIYKYHGAGNDFVMIDGISHEITISCEQVRKLCHRNFGIGADGLIILRPDENADFRMEYYNSDGSRATMCGNGARCAVAFADHLGFWGTFNTFSADDGMHHGTIITNHFPSLFIQISLYVNDDFSEIGKDSFFINTGVPHFVKFVNDINELDILSEGRKIRFDSRFMPEGTNVNFVRLDLLERKIDIRTYERGVEDETLACGTGITAAALAAHYALGWSFPIDVRAKGGELIVDRGIQNEFFLKGPSQFVFSSEITLV